MADKRGDAVQRYAGCDLPGAGAAAVFSGAVVSGGMLAAGASDPAGEEGKAMIELLYVFWRGFAFAAGFFCFDNLVKVVGKLIEHRREGGEPRM